MKKLLLMAVSLAALAGLASATTVTCGGFLMSPNTNGTGGPTCTATADPGFFLSALTLSSGDDYTGYISGNPTVNFFISILQNPGFTDINGITPVYTTTANGCAVNTTPGAPFKSIPCSNAPQTITGDFGGSVTVQLGGGDTVDNGSVTGASIVYTLDYTETAITTDPPSAPEPATLGLMGGALVGLGLLARKKK